MKTFLVNNEFEIDAPDPGSAYEMANEMGLEIETVVPVPQWAWID